MNFYRATAPEITNDINGGLFHKRKENLNPYPIWHGYETVGRVVEVGSDVKDYKVGDIAWFGAPHADQHVCETTVNGRPGFGEKAPEGADPAAGIFLALSGVSYDGLLTSRLRLGECGVVSGLGVIGLICVQLARLAGVHPLIAVDPIPLRRHKALEYGADHALDPTEEPVAEIIRNLNDRRGADAVIETSGNWGALHEAIRCCASKFGRVVALGFYQGPGQELRLGEEFHHSSFYPMGASEILAINHRKEPSDDRAWDIIRIYHICAGMLGSGALATKDLLTHVFPWEEAEKAFRLVDKHPNQVIKVALECQCSRDKEKTKDLEVEEDRDRNNGSSKIRVLR